MCRKGLMPLFQRDHIWCIRWRCVTLPLTTCAPPEANLDPAVSPSYDPKSSARVLPHPRKGKSSGIPRAPNDVTQACVEPCKQIKAERGDGNQRVLLLPNPPTPKPDLPRSPAPHSPCSVQPCPCPPPCCSVDRSLLACRGRFWHSHQQAGCLQYCKHCMALLQ